MLRIIFALLCLILTHACAKHGAFINPRFVGLQDLTVTDNTRSDIVNSETDRRFAVRILYPTCQQLTPAPYVDDALLDALQADDYFFQQEEVFQSWGVRTLASKDAPECSGPWPAATLSIGLGVSGFQYSLLAEKLANAGIVTIIIDHPYGAHSRLPDGTILNSNDDKDLARIDEDPTILADRTSDWARDISIVIDRLVEKSLIEGLNINTEKLYAIGHSMGGAAALDACLYDDRLAGCVDMDGAPFGTKAMEAGLKGDNLILFSNPLYTEVDHAARGRTKEDWDAMGEQINALWSDIIAKSDGKVHRVSVAGTGHMSFSDAPIVMPDAINRFGGKPMAPERAMDAISGVLIAYMDQNPNEIDTFEAYLEHIPELNLLKPN